MNIIDMRIIDTCQVFFCQKAKYNYCLQHNLVDNNFILILQWNRLTDKNWWNIFIEHSSQTWAFLVQNISRLTAYAIRNHWFLVITIWFIINKNTLSFFCILQQYFVAMSKRKVEHPLSTQRDIKFGALGIRWIESARA